MNRLRELINDVHRRSLWQVLGIYLVGSWIGYQVIIALVQGIGLPDWVPGFAIVLFIIGLPLVLATAFVQEGLPRGARSGAGARRRGRRGAAGSKSAPPARATPAGQHWLLTWQRATVAGVVAFFLLGITVAGYMVARNAGIGPAGSLIAKGALQERERLLIADFESSTGDEDLARALTQAFRVDLAQSPVMHVLEPAHVRDVLERMGASPTTPLGPEIVQQVAVRDGVKAYIIGDVLRAGRSYSLSASLLTAGDGSVLASFRETAADSAAVLDAIGRLSRRMRERVGESLRSVHATRRLESVTTPSLDALRKYSEAVHALDVELNLQLGVALLQEALAHDSTFGMAWRKLAVAHSNMAVGRDPVIRAATKAYEYRDRMTSRERDHTVAYYHYAVTRDNMAAIAAYRTLLRNYPDDYTGHHNIALAYSREQRFDLAAEHQQRAIEIRPHQPNGYTNLAGRLHHIGRIDEAKRTLDEYERRFGETRTSLAERMHLAYSEGDLDAVNELAVRLRELDPSDAHARAESYHALADLSALRGGLGAEERQRATAVAAELERGAASLPLTVELLLAERDVDLLGDTAGALRRLESALARHPLTELPAVDRPYHMLIGLYARAGKGTAARDLHQEYEREVPEDRRGELRATALWRAAAFAGADGDLPEALRQLRLLEPVAPCKRCVARWSAVAFDRLGQPDSAIARYEQFLALHEGRMLWSDAYALAPAHERLAELYHLRGDHERAALHAARFVELWQEADPVLRPRVDSKLALLSSLQRR
jgi:eukaryotic-like serine/threonine-protein kinase